LKDYNSEEFRNFILLFEKSKAATAEDAISKTFSQFKNYCMSHRRARCQARRTDYAIYGFKDLLLAVGGRHGPLFPAQRSHGKKLVPAGCAAQRGEPEDTPGNRSYTWHTLGRNALQFQVAANPAMSVEEGTKWQGVSVKS
jgi:hypothetical protein